MGFDLCRLLIEIGYKVIGVSRDVSSLQTLNIPKDKLLTFAIDLTKKENVYAFFEQVKDYEISHVFNNAGSGLIGSFIETDIEKEINMINTNVIALVILTKLFLKKFDEEKSNGKIINIGSLAGNLPGPLQSVYYATKSFVNNFTQAIQFEVKKEKRSAKVILVQPGSVKTNFRKNAGSSRKDGYESH
jgi:short-subunit dehydrogenase